MIRIKGFNLIELMITLVIISILISIAYPAYTNYIIRARRADAQAALLQFANAMERYYTEQSPSTYTGAGTADADADGDGDTGAPTIFPTQAPVDGGDAYYDLTIQAVNDTSYTLRATPIAGTTQATNCFLQLDSVGNKAWDRNNDTDLLDADETTWN